MALAYLSLGWLIGLWFGLATAAGVGQTDQLKQLEPLLLGLAALSVVGAALGRGQGRLLLTGLAVGVASLGVWRAYDFGVAENALEGWNGFLTLRGTISSRPEPRDAALLLNVEVEELIAGSRREPVRARVLVRTDRYGDWVYGDRVAASGQLAPVKTGTGYWAEYLGRQGIYATLEYPRLILEDRSTALEPQRILNDVRASMERVCSALLPEPQASLLGGVLVGGRSSMPADFRDALNSTSTSHIVAVSGFNVTVVAGMALFVALRFLGRRKATVAAIAAVWLYSALTGLPPSALRAAIMATMMLSAVFVGRGGDTFSSLCLAAALMAAFDPLILYDLGYQLSFVATAGLVLLEPVFRSRLTRLPGWLATSLAITLAAQIATLPILASNFHNLSLISPVTNLLIAPVLPAVMGFGAFSVVMGLLAEPAGQLAAFPAWLLLTYLVEIIGWTARLPGASLPTGNLGPEVVGGFYLALVGIAMWPMPETRPVREAILGALARLPILAAAGAFLVIAGLAALAISTGRDSAVHIYFLDVGHGDATLIRSPEGYQVLVDGGPSPTAITGALGRRLPFLDRNLDAVVLTGYSDDRLAGLIEVARRHSIGLVLEPAGPEPGAAGKAWKELVAERKIPVVRAAQGQRIALGPDTFLEVLWAPEADAPVEDAALLLRLSVGSVNVLLPGDLSRGVQRQIAMASAGQADVLRIPQHGAAGSLDEQWLQLVAPRAAIISVQSGNSYGHPADSTLGLLGRDAAIFRTDRDGTVDLSVGREGYELYTER